MVHLRICTFAYLHIRSSDPLDECSDMKTYLEEEIARVELNAAKLYLSIVVSNDYTKLQQYHELEEDMNSLKNDLSRVKEHHDQNSVRSTSQMLTWRNILPRWCLLRA